MKHRHIAVLMLGAAALGGTSTFAQYDQSISVEGKYVPEFIAQDRIGFFPKAIKFPLEKSTLAFESDGVNADFTPQAIPIPATGWKDTRIFSRNRGYLDFGLGSWLESTLSAGYRFIDKESTAVGIRLQHNSISLWHPRLCDIMHNTYMRRYDEMAGLYATHALGDMGRLNVAVDYHLGYFNYYGYCDYPLEGIATPENAKTPTQTVNDVAARVEWLSPAKTDDVCWQIGLGTRYFGYRRYYEFAGINHLSEDKGPQETDASLYGNVTFPTSSKSTIGIDLDSHLLLYNRLADAEKSSYRYGTLSLTPYYRFTHRKLNVSIGAKVDLSFDARTAMERYRTFNIAPSVKLDYNAGPVSMYLNLLGGNRLHTLAYMHEQDYYCTPLLTASAPAYSPIDGRMGFAFGPFSGFSAGLEVRYRVTQDQELYGWYTQSLMAGSAERLSLPLDIDGHPLDWFQPGQRTSLHGFSTGLNMAYDAGRYFRIDANGSYQPQKGKTGYFNGMDRPRWTARASMSSNPWNSLRINLSCDYRGVRSFPILGYLDGMADDINGSGDAIHMYRVDDWFSLNFSASYQIKDWIGVWVEADNLTNRRNMAAPGLPEPGIRMAAGLSLTF